MSQLHYKHMLIDSFFKHLSDDRCEERLIMNHVVSKPCDLLVKPLPDLARVLTLKIVMQQDDLVLQHFVKGVAHQSPHVVAAYKPLERFVREHSQICISGLVTKVHIVIICK